MKSVLLMLVFALPWLVPLVLADEAPVPKAGVSEHELSIVIERSDALVDFPPLAAKADQLAKQAMTEFRAQFAKRPRSTYSSNWSLELHYHPGSSNSQWATLIEGGYRYTGGAHGMPLSSRHTWSYRQEAWLDIDQVLSGEQAWQTISDFVHAVVLARRFEQHAPVDPDTLRAWQQSLDEGAPAEPTAWRRFELIADGDRLRAIRFLIPPYAIGPYAEGVHVIDMPAHLLAPWLADEFKPVPAPDSALLSRKQGHFQPDAEQAVWRDCGADKARQSLRMSAGVAQVLEPMLEAGATTLFIDGLWQDDGQFLAGLLRVEGEGHGCDLDISTFDYRAQGNEPFWSAELDDQTIRFRYPGEQARAIDVERSDERSREWQLSDGGWFSVLALPCRDSMSGNYFAYTALHRDAQGTTHSGCAVPGKSQ